MQFAHKLEVPAREGSCTEPQPLLFIRKFCCSGKPQQHLQSQQHIDFDFVILWGKQELFTPFSIYIT